MIDILKRIFFVLLIVALIIWTKPVWEAPVRKVLPEEVSDILQSAADFTTQTIDKYFDLEKGKSHIFSLYSSIRDSIQGQEVIEKPKLMPPDEQHFSIGNIEVGDRKADVEAIYGEPKRESENDYGVSWSTYHENYQNFIMVAYDDEGVVCGLFTNQELLSSQFNLALGDRKAVVNEILGKPEEIIRNGWFQYRINSEGEYDVYKIDGDYVTIFYDIHEDEKLTAIQIIDGDLESSKDTLYTSGSEALKEGFEYQLFDLTNAIRVNHGLSILEWDESVRETARKHSRDMAENQFFGHTNLQGKSPFDRMQADGIFFTAAGENLAYGQLSSVFAHQGLMNSLGHRENILNGNFTKLGIGVDFDDNNQPFYTENFFRN